MTFTPVDIKDIAHLLVLQPSDWEISEEHLFNLITNRHSRTFKLKSNDQLVGMGALTLHENTAWLSHIVVKNHARNKGFGSQITQFLMNEAFKMGCKTIQLTATPLGESVYKRLGFQHLTRYNFFENLPKSENPIHPYIIPFNVKWTNAILGLDEEISGELRENSLKPHLKSGFYYVENDQLLGFYLPSLTEGLIIAENSEVGFALLNLHLKSKNKIVVPDENLAVMDYLGQLGYVVSSNALRMYFGDFPSVKLNCIYNRIGGALG